MPTGTGSLPSGENEEEVVAQIPNILFITCLIQRRNKCRSGGLGGEGRLAWEPLATIPPLGAKPCPPSPSEHQGCSMGEEGEEGALGRSRARSWAWGQED